MISGDKSHPPPSNPNSQLETVRAICRELEGSGRIEGTVLRECSLKMLRMEYPFRAVKVGGDLMEAIKGTDLREYPPENEAYGMWGAVYPFRLL